MDHRNHSQMTDGFLHRQTDAHSYKHTLASSTTTLRRVIICKSAACTQLVAQHLTTISPNFAFHTNARACGIVHVVGNYLSAFRHPTTERETEREKEKQHSSLTHTHTHTHSHTQKASAVSPGRGRSAPYHDTTERKVFFPTLMDVGNPTV